MLDASPKHGLATEFRFALDVLDEYSHLGLDENYARKLREILERRISESEEAICCCPALPIRFPTSINRE